MVGGVLLPNARHIQCEAERSSPWRYRSQRLPRESLRSPQTYQGFSVPPPLREVCPHDSTRGLRAHGRGERLPGDLSFMHHTQTKVGQQRVAWCADTERVLPHPAATLLHLDSWWSPAGAETRERRMDRSTCCARSSRLPSLPPLSRLYGLPPPTDASTRSLRIPAALPPSPVPYSVFPAVAFYNSYLRHRIRSGSTNTTIGGAVFRFGLILDDFCGDSLGGCTGQSLGSP